MPSTSPKQHNFMEMIAHDPGKAREKGVPQSVGRDFVEADKNQGTHGRAPMEGLKRAAHKHAGYRT